MSIRCVPGGLVVAWLALVVAGCASAPAPEAANANNTTSAATSCNREKDRAAIRQLAGEFWVDFHFEETIPLRDAYKPAAAYETAGRELVVIVEDDATHVVLQHILVVPSGTTAKAIKHWREDWQFEDNSLLEFRGKRVWGRRQIPAGETSCHWSQAVFEVDDAPRYEAIGRWQHDGSHSTWTSNVTWRPLPRREYTKRSDYDVLVGTNRVTVTPEGWAHEQDNEKLILSPQPTRLVREVGINRYIRQPDESIAAATAYWQLTAKYWALVREEWAQVINGNRVELVSEIDGRPAHELLLSLADAEPSADLRTRVRDTIKKSLANRPAAAN